jgi:organic radical activating enzyme
MSNKTYCNFPFTGMYISHRGPKLCCVNKHWPDIEASKFWNGDYHKQSKIQMEQGQRVVGCETCYDKENLKILSSRNIYQSEKHIPKKELPTKLDLDLSNFCNLKCIMCNSRRSSQWAKDEGLYLENKGINTVSQTVLDDICKISKDLEYLTIQGGEPSIMPEFIYYFDFLKRNNIIKNINLQVITNLTNLNTKFFDFLKNFKSVQLSVSIDAYGSVNEYIRYPSNFKQIEKNLIELSDRRGNINVEILNSIQILSLLNYDEFLNWCKKIEGIYHRKNKTFKIVAMKVTNPIIYNLFNAPKKLKDKFINDIDIFFKTNPNSLKNNNHFKTELQLLVKQLIASTHDEKVLDIFKQKIQELDLERNINISSNITNFYNYF